MESTNSVALFLVIKGMIEITACQTLLLKAEPNLFHNPVQLLDFEQLKLQLLIGQDLNHL